MPRQHGGSIWADYLTNAIELVIEFQYQQRNLSRSLVIAFLSALRSEVGIILALATKVSACPLERSVMYGIIN